MNQFGPYTIDERTVAQFGTSVNLKIEIIANTTKHAEERKFRHDKEIKDSEIRATVFKATEQIMQKFVDGKLKEDQKFHIYDPGNDHLNIIALFNMNDAGTPEKIKIVTIMRNKNFHSNEAKIKIKV